MLQISKRALTPTQTNRAPKNFRESMACGFLPHKKRQWINAIFPKYFARRVGVDLLSKNFLPARFHANKKYQRRKNYFDEIDYFNIKKKCNKKLMQNLFCKNFFNLRKIYAQLAARVHLKISHRKKFFQKKSAQRNFARNVRLLKKRKMSVVENHYVGQVAIFSRNVQPESEHIFVGDFKTFKVRIQTAFVLLRLVQQKACLDLLDTV